MCLESALFRWNQILTCTLLQGNVGTWKKKPGDKITAGDVLVEIETDKATVGSPAWPSRAIETR